MFVTEATATMLDVSDGPKNINIKHDYMYQIIY